MAKRPRDSVNSVKPKVQQRQRRPRKTGEVDHPLVADKRSITPETGPKAKNEDIAPKIRIGPNLILTGPNRNAIDVVEETDRESAMSGILHGHADEEHKREGEDHVHIYRRQQDGREVLDSVMVSSGNWENKCAASKVSGATMVEQLRLMEAKLRRADEISRLKVALDEKTKELDAAISFMNVREPLSGAEIITLANAFNDEVFQGAAHIAEGLGSSKHRYPEYQKRIAQCKGEYEQALMSLGPNLLEDLTAEGEDYSNGYFLLQVAMQVCMVNFGVNVLQCWSPDKNEHKVTDQIYQRILSKENQEVAGSWRSVTLRSQRSEPMQRKMDALLYTIIDILTVAGWWSREEEPSGFFTKFQGNLVRIVDSALKLREAIGSVTHMDILPMTVPPESHFCPEVMANFYASNTGAARVSESDKVLATTELGLERKVKRSEGDTQGAVLLKPKVVLRSALLSFLESDQDNR
ncbi:hypothetical protein C0989_008356 [Termitomyces sp. Mn162]|nr:hypothetical protein C0989_008356 [Termitomyces sp. Mn162]